MEKLESLELKNHMSSIPGEFVGTVRGFFAPDPPETPEVDDAEPAPQEMIERIASSTPIPSSRCTYSPGRWKICPEVGLGPVGTKTVQLPSAWVSVKQLCHQLLIR